MANWRITIALAAFLPGVAAAADSAMLELIMPDARVVAEINLDRIVASPVGQVISLQMKNELQAARADWQQPLAGFNGLDWSHFAQEVVFASTGANAINSPSLVIVRGLLDPAWIESLSAIRGSKGTYMGVPTLQSNGGSSMVAFLEGSIAVIGRSADVKAALQRRGQNTPPSPVLAEALEKYEGQYDAWMVSAVPLSAPNKYPAGSSFKWTEQVASFTGGVRMSPDVEMSAEMTMRNEKDVADMRDTLKWLSFVGQTQDKTAGLDNMKLDVDGKKLSFFLQVPEQQVRAALAQRQPGQRPQAIRPAAKPVEISNGMPEPPSGTIRVQSSPGDMGTVLLPLNKTK